jgi:hypothetical protein
MGCVAPENSNDCLVCVLRRERWTQKFTGKNFKGRKF